MPKRIVFDRSKVTPGEARIIEGMVTVARNLASFTMVSVAHASQTALGNSPPSPNELLLGDDDGENIADMVLQILQEAYPDLGFRFEGSNPAPGASGKA